MKNERYHTLDALRGVGAMFVMVCHFGQATGFPHVVAPDIKNVAVDLFFCLSGFVMHHAYEARLRRGLSLTGFMEQRLLRLYPVYLLGLLLGLASVLPALWKAGAWGQAAPVALANLVMAPLPWRGGAQLLQRPDYLFPLAPAAWSLMFELIANVAFAAVLPRLGRRGLALVTAACALGFVAALLWFGSDEMGWSGPTALGGLARAAVGFCMGWLLGRVVDPGLRRVRPLASAGAIALLLGLTMTVTPPAWRAPYEIAAVLLGAPALVALGACAELPARFRRLAAWGGDVSYPLYMLHIPLMNMLLLADHRTLRLPAPVLLATLVVVGLGVSHLSLRAFDAPLRGWMSRRLRAMRATPALHPA